MTNWATEEMSTWLSNDEGAYNEIMDAPECDRCNAIQFIAKDWIFGNGAPDGFLDGFDLSDYRSIRWDELAKDFADPVKEQTMKPQKLSMLDIVFPTDVTRLMPRQDSVPEEFTNKNNKYVKLVSQWFAIGLNACPLSAKPGIDRLDALGHLKAIMGSFEPSHEYKISAVAYLLSQWFDVSKEDE